MDYILGWLILSGLVAYIANLRGRLPIDYFFLSLLLSPLIGFIILFAKSNLTEEAKNNRIQREAQDRNIELITRTQESKNPALEQVSSVLLVADEIEKLSNLHKNGVLTSEEFQSRKALLLNRS